jgi:hypothetical protein
MVLSVAFAVVGGFLVPLAYKSAVILLEDAIELRTIFVRKRLLFVAIRGRREYVVNGGGDEGSTRYLRLEPNDDRLPALDFARNFNFDGAFYAWFNKLPDLDAMDKIKHKDANFGLV